MLYPIGDWQEHIGESLLSLQRNKEIDMKKAAIVMSVVLIALLAFVSCNKPSVTATPQAVTETTAEPVEKAPTFKVSFKPSNGSGTMKDMEFTGTGVVPACGFTAPEGYIFESWNTKEDGSGDAYTIGSLISSTKNVTLYATWKPASYPIVIGKPEVNGGIVTSSAQAYYISELDQHSSIQLTEVFPGYTFVGFGNDETDHVKGYPGVTLIGNADSDVAHLIIPTGVVGTVEIVPEFRAHTYEVSYDPNGGLGDLIADTYFVYGEEGNLAENTYTNEFFTFYGWNTEPDGSGVNYADGEEVINLTTEDNGKITLYANWLPFVTITFVANNDTSETTIQRIASGVDNELDANTFTRAGYTFGGWATTADGQAVYEDCGTVSDTVDFNLYAVWNYIDYSINFAQVPHGTASASTTEYVVGYEDQKITLAADPDAGYKFIGWNVDSETGASVSGDVLTIPAGSIGDVVVSPVFGPIDYSLTFGEAKGGMAVASKNTYNIGETDQTIDMHVYTADGYVLDSWTIEGDEGVYVKGNLLVIPADAIGDLKVTPVFKALDYSLTVVQTKGGKIGISPVSYNVSDNAQVIALAVVEENGYKLDSVTTDAKGVAVYPNSIRIPAGTIGDIVVTAKFDAIDYAINLASTDRGGASASEKTYNISDKEQRIALTPEGEKGAQIDTWKVSGNDDIYVDGNTLVIPAGTVGDVSVAPVFKDSTYTVIYSANADDATGSTPDSEHDYGVSKELSENEYFRVGYLFRGWNTEPDGSGTSYEDCQAVEALTDEPSITLYAQWEALVPFTVDKSTLLADGEVLESVYTRGIILDRRYIMVADGPIYGADGRIISDEVTEIIADIELPFYAYNGGVGYPLNDAGEGQQFYREAGDEVTVIYTHSPVWVVKKF